MQYSFYKQARRKDGMGRDQKVCCFGKCSCRIVCAKRGGIPAIPTKEAVLEFMMWYKKLTPHSQGFEI